MGRLVPYGSWDREVRGRVTIGAGVTAMIASIEIPEGGTSYLIAHVQSKRQANNEAGGYYVQGSYRRAAGVVTAVAGSPIAGLTSEDDATAAAALVINGTSVEVRGTTPAAKTYEWQALIQSLDLIA